MSIIDVLSSKVKAVQTKIEHFIDGIPTIQKIVEETINVEEKKTHPKIIEIDGEYEINSQEQLALKHPVCAIHGTKYITKNGWTRNTLELITGDKIKIIRQMHICNKCETTILPSLQCLKIPFERITKDGQRYLLELTIEDGLSLRKAKRRLKNTFGLEISIDRLRYLIQTTGKKCEEFTEELDKMDIFCFGINHDFVGNSANNAIKK